MDRRERFDNPHDMLLVAMQGMQSGLWTAMPGIVKAYDPTEMTVTVQLAIQMKVQLPDYTFVWKDVTPLIHCPVIFPSGGGATITFPMVAGDEVLMIFASRCIDAWWQSGGYKNTQVEFRLHDLSDGFALPGPRSKPRVLSALSSSALQIRSDDGVAYIELNPTNHNIKAHTTANVVVEAANVTATVTSALSATCATANVTASSQATVQAPTINLTGNVIVSGTLTVAGAAALNGGMAVAGGGSNTATINAPMTVNAAVTTNGTLTNNGVNVGSTHVHGGVQPGSGNSAVPH